MEKAVLKVKSYINVLIYITILFLSQSTAFSETKTGKFLVLCYHAIPLNAPKNDPYSVSQKSFIEQMEFLRTHNYTVVSIKDIVNAASGKKKLPPKSVLLTFDDAYISYYEFVKPVLERMGYPSVLSVVGKFIDHPPDNLPEPLMSWKQIQRVSRSDLVEIASHSYDLHRAIQYNPQGNVAPAVNVRLYKPDKGSYESEGEYRQRLAADFATQKRIFHERLGIEPAAIVWPFGTYNSISIEVAEKNGLPIMFTLEEGYARLNNLRQINRILVENRPVKDFVRLLKDPVPEPAGMRAVQVDMDLIYDPESYEKTDANLGAVIERLLGMKINTVFLQAFADPDGDGNIKSVYFNNRIMPVRSDIFSHAVHQMFIRGIKVYAWMPVLSFELPDRTLNEKLRVRSMSEGEPVESGSWYKRLTPFSPETVKIVRQIYEDLAAHTQIHGVLFQDDAYLADDEDFHPAARARYREEFGREIYSSDLRGRDDIATQLARFKTEALIDFTRELMEGVRRFKPVAKFARNIYAGVIDDLEAESWLAQNFELFIKNYDLTVVMAYPQMEQKKRSLRWIRRLVSSAKSVESGIDKTVFKLQAYDWRNKAWISEQDMLDEMREILASGGRHLAYYPDNYSMNRPVLDKIRLEMSTEVFPFFQ